MTIVVLVILAGLWAVVLLPPWLRNRTENRPGDSIVSFRNQLSILERTTPGALGGRIAPNATVAPVLPAPGLPLSRAEARKRRRDVLKALIGLAVVTFALALVGPSVFWMVHITADLLLAGFVAMLVQTQKMALERTEKVRFLPTQPAPEPALLLRRSAQ